MWWRDHERPEDRDHIRHLPFRELVARVAPLFRPHLGALGIGVVLMFATVAAELAAPVILRRLIDDDLRAGVRSGVLRTAALYAVVFLAGTAAAYFQVVVLTRMGLAVVTRLKRRLFRHVLGLSLAYFDKHSPGTLLARVESDAERLQALFSEVAVSVLRTVLLTVGTLAMMLSMNAPLTLAIVCLAVPVVAGTVWFFRRMRALYRRCRAIYARISGFVAEYVQGVPVVQVYGYENRASARLAALNDTRVAAERRAAMMEYGFWGLLTTMEVVAIIVILWVGLGETFGLSVTAGTIVAFIEYTRKIFWPIALFSEQLNFIQRAFASADRVFAVLDTPSRTPDRADARADVPADWKEVAFDRVTFEYDGGTRALDDVSFHIRRGEKVALVGLSGGGKTTITNLLLRFYEPTEGAVRLDAEDIRAYRQVEWRKKIGLVQQDIHLFPGTVADNVRALAEGIPLAAVERAVETVGATGIVARLPGGFDEELAEGGANLSMGERQLLCFARAIVRDPDLLVLDEATSSVDPATERRLQEAVDRLLSGRTSLVIAHRLATVTSADRILVVHGGKIVDEGPHAELYARGGIYRDLFDLQFRSAS